MCMLYQFTVDEHKQFADVYVGLASEKGVRVYPEPEGEKGSVCYWATEASVGALLEAGVKPRARDTVTAEYVPVFFGSGISAHAMLLAADLRAQVLARQGVAAVRVPEQNPEEAARVWNASPEAFLSWTSPAGESSVWRLVSSRHEAEQLVRQVYPDHPGVEKWLKSFNADNYEGLLQQPTFGEPIVPVAGS